MDKEENMNKEEEKILKLLEQYHHYLFMTKNVLFTGYGAGMNLYGFMQWLESREK